MEIALVFAALAIAANLFCIWYAKRKYYKKKANESSKANGDTFAYAQGFFNTPEGKQLLQSAADELNLSYEELGRMSVEEITQLAEKQEFI